MHWLWLYNSPSWFHRKGASLASGPNRFEGSTGASQAITQLQEVLNWEKLNLEKFDVSQLIKFSWLEIKGFIRRATLQALILISMHFQWQNAREPFSTFNPKSHWFSCDHCRNLSITYLDFYSLQSLFGLNTRPVSFEDESHVGGWQVQSWWDNVWPIRTAITLVSVSCYFEQEWWRSQVKCF